MYNSGKTDADHLKLFLYTDLVRRLALNYLRSKKLQCRDSAITVTAVLTGKVDHIGSQGRLVIARLGYLALH